MAVNDEPPESPTHRFRRVLEAMIDAHKATVVRLHLEASKLTGRPARELRQVADEMDEYAESLRERLMQRRYRELQ
jgi:hypothetical protein